MQVNEEEKPRVNTFVRPVLFCDVFELPKCPKCGAEVSKPAKTWKMKSAKSTGRALFIGFFKCSKCGAKFRKAHRQKRP